MHSLSLAMGFGNKTKKMMEKLKYYYDSISTCSSKHNNGQTDGRWTEKKDRQVCFERSLK